MTGASLKIWIYVAITGYNVDSSGKYACILQYYTNKYIKNHRDPYANLLSAKNGSEAPRPLLNDRAAALVLVLHFGWGPDLFEICHSHSLKAVALV
jgi:hypothetical protein